MGRQAEVEALYRAMPEVFRRLKTWSFYVLHGLSRFRGVVGQKADRRRKLYNGRIECTYYQFYGPRPPATDGEGQRRREVDGRGEGERREAGRSDAQEAAVEERNRAGEETEASGGRREEKVKGERVRMKRRERKDEGRVAEVAGTRLSSIQAGLRRPVGRRPASRPSSSAAGWRSGRSTCGAGRRRGITCYRLYERDIPEVPLVVDRYEDCLHIAEYERPHERTPAEHADWLDLMKRTAAETLGVPLQNVFLKRRQRQRGAAQYERLAEQGGRCVVSEGGLRFDVNLSDYLDTGLFLDHRITRAMVRERPPASGS